MEAENAVEMESTDDGCASCDEELNSDLTIQEEVPVYDVKDEKICRNKREAEKLSKTIKKTIKVKDVKVAEQQKVKPKEQPKSSKTLKKVKDESAKRDTQTVKADKKNQQKGGKSKSKSKGKKSGNQKKQKGGKKSGQKKNKKSEL